MRIRTSAVGAMTVAGLALLALAGPSQHSADRVVLNPDPPSAPRWGLEWDLGAPPEPTQAGAPATVPAEEPRKEQAAGAGIWATPATFSDSD